MLSPHNSFKWACYSVILTIKVLVGRLTHLTDYGVDSWHASSNCKSCTKGSHITWHCCMKLRVEPAHPQLKTLIIISLLEWSTTIAVVCPSLIPHCFLKIYSTKNVHSVFKVVNLTHGCCHWMFWGGAMDRYTVTRCSEVVHSIWRERQIERLSLNVHRIYLQLWILWCSLTLQKWQ